MRLRKFWLITLKTKLSLFRISYWLFHKKTFFNTSITCEVSSAAFSKIFSRIDSAFSCNRKIFFWISSRLSLVIIQRKAFYSVCVAFAPFFCTFFFTVCTRSSEPILYSRLLNKMGHYFFDIGFGVEPHVRRLN